MKAEIQINVNHEVLVWARESLALSQNQVTEKTKISLKRLIQLETGIKQPSLSEVEALSKTYKRTIATILLNKPPSEKPLPVDRRTIDSQESGNFHEKTILAVRKARAMAQAFVELKAEMGLEFPKFKFELSVQEKPKVVANRVRQLLELDEMRKLTDIDHALQAYIEKVESLGIAVFQMSLTHDNLRGFVIIDDLIPIIGIKRGREQAHSKTFTLFHELGHILLKEGGLCDLFEKEKWCNAFAAEVLVPTAELLKMELVLEHLSQGQKIWQKNDLVKLATYFHVGPLAILRRLLENGLTTKEYYQEKHKQWNKEQFGKAKHPEGRNVAKEAVHEKGRTYISLAFKAFDQNRINIKDLSDFLGVKLANIPKMRQLLYS